GSEHEGTGGTHPDAVPAEDAGRLRQHRVELGRDAGVEAPTRHPDRERVLGLDAARLDALVTENAAGVVTDVERIVHLDRLLHGLCGRPVRHRMVTGMALVAVGDGRGGRSETPRFALVSLHPR